MLRVLKLPMVFVLLTSATCFSNSLQAQEADIPLDAIMQELNREESVAPSKDRKASTAWVGGRPDAKLVSEKAQRNQFVAAGIKLIVNRVVKQRSQSQIVMSLVLQNTSDVDVGVFLYGSPAIISDAGDAMEASKVAGLDVCGTGVGWRSCSEYANRTIIERGASILTTVVFRNRSRRQRISACSLDLTMSAGIADTSAQSVRRVSFGLPNINIC